MTPRNYSLLAAAVFTLIALLQLARAVSGWPQVVVDNTWSLPLWPNWIAFVVFAILAWFGFRAARS
jgi:membrane protein implicated in regulation of membrane protease activity